MVEHKFSAKDLLPSHSLRAPIATGMALARWLREAVKVIAFGAGPFLILLVTISNPTLIPLGSRHVSALSALFPESACRRGRRALPGGALI